MRIERPVAAEVQAAVDLVKLRSEWERACGREDRAEKSLAEVRLEKGRILADARKAFPARGPKAKGWGELLAKWRIEPVTAWNYMKLAGYVDEVSSTDEETRRVIPTYAEAGITRPRAAPTEVEEESTEIEPMADPAPRANDWPARVERLAEDLQRHTKAMFSIAQELDAICVEHEASIGSPSLLTARSMLAGVKASVADALQLMGGTNERR